MKKILIGLLGMASVYSYADSFQDFNNNVYTSYELVSPTYNNAKNLNNWGIGGTVQTKNDVWLAGMASMGQSNADSSGLSQNVGSVGLKAGYAFQFFNAEDNGFQVIPYVSFSTQQGTVVVGNNNAQTGLNNGQIYNYGLGVQPEYRLFGSFKLALGMGMYGNQVSVNGADQQNFNYYVAPEVQYDIAKMVMLSAGYNYTNSFNATNSVTGTGGTNSVNFKVGYLF